MELNELQIRVQNEFFTIKMSKTSKMEDDLRNAGCLTSPFAPLFMALSKKALKTAQRKKSHDIYEVEADELLKNSELKKEICSSLILITKGEVVTEENFINYVTTILYENKIRTKFVIPLEPALFAYIAYKISENGINNFCSENAEN